MAARRESYIKYDEELRRLLPRSLCLRTVQAEEDLNRLSRQMRRAIDSLDSSASPESTSNGDDSSEDEYPIHESGYSSTDSYLKKAKTFFEMRSLIEGTEADNCATSKLFVEMHQLLLAEFVDACASLISREKLKLPIRNYVLEEGLVWVLVELTKLALLKSSAKSSGDISLIECKIIEESLRWLRDKQLALDRDSLCLLLSNVFVPVLGKSRKFADFDVHVTRVDYRSEFERFCRCSSDYSIHGIAESLKILALNDERALEWAFEEFDDLQDVFSDSLLDVCIGSLIEDGQWERVYDILDRHAAPKATSDDRLERRKAAWLFNISLENEPEKIHQLLARYKSIVLALLADECPAVRREAHLFWFRVGLTRDNGLEVVELVAEVATKMIEHLKADELAHDEGAEFEILRHAGTWFTNTKTNEMSSSGYVRPISRLKFSRFDWLALPVLQDKLKTSQKIDRFYCNFRIVIAALPSKRVLSELEKMIDMYEELLSRENLIWLDFYYVLLMAHLRLLLERTSVANESWSRVFSRNRCRAMLRFLEGTQPCAFEPIRQLSLIIKYLRRPTNLVAILAAIDVAGTFLASTYKWLDTSPSAKLLELLACQIHQQDLHCELNDRLIWERFEASLGDPAADRQIQMVMAVNYMADGDRKRAHQDVMRIVGKLDLTREPAGIHNKRVLLQLLSKYIQDFKDNLVELKALLPMALNLSVRLTRAYELTRTGEYSHDEDADCQVTCWEMAYSSESDDKSSFLYECELHQYLNSLNGIDRTMLGQFIKLDKFDEFVRCKVAKNLAEKPSLDLCKLKVRCSYQSYLSNRPKECIMNSAENDRRRDGSTNTIAIATPNKH